MTIRRTFPLVLALSVALAPAARATQLYYDANHFAKQRNPSLDPNDPAYDPVKAVQADAGMDANGCLVGTVGKPVTYAMQDQAPEHSYFGFYGGAYGGGSSPIPGLEMSESGLVTGTPAAAGGGSFGYFIAGPVGANYSYMGYKCYQIGGDPKTASAIAIGSAYGYTVEPGAQIDLPAPPVTGFVGRLSWSVNPSPPTGLTFSAGQVDGAAEAEGEWTYTVTATDSTGASATTDPTTLTFQKPPPVPVLSTGPSCIYTTKDEFQRWNDWQWQNQPSEKIKWTGFVPSGMTLDTDTGEISGKPDQGYANQHFTGRLFITAYWYDDYGEHDASGSPCVNDSPEGLSVDGGSGTTVKVNDKVATQVPVTHGGSGGVTWSVSPPLPVGLSLAGGSITGTARYPLDYYYTLTATDADGNSASTDPLQLSVVDDTVNVSAGPSCLKGDSLQSFTDFPFVVRNLPPAGVTWSFVESSLPQHWSVSKNGGLIQGVFFGWNHDTGTNYISPTYDSGGSATGYTFNLTLHVLTTVTTPTGVRSFTTPVCYTWPAEDWSRASAPVVKD